MAPDQKSAGAAAPRPADAIVLRDIGRTYRDGAHTVEALRGINLTVAPAAFVALLGPSGCGKSTLLNIIAGFEPPSAGEVIVNGTPVRGPSAERGVVFQDTAALFPWLTVAENVAFGLRAGRASREEVRARVAAVLDLVRLSRFSDRLPRELSGGMRQLVAIARVLVMNPKLLLMDEPFAALDAITRQRLQSRLTAIWEKTGIAILFITHSVDEAIYLADEVAVMSGRPGTVRARLAIDLPRPRSATSLRFNAFKEQTLAHLIPPEDRDDDI